MAMVGTGSNMEALTQEQVDEFNKVGAIVVPDRLSSQVLSMIHSEIDRFMDEARELDKSNDRLDLEDSHSPQNPRVRRIKLPHMISEVVRDLMFSDKILAPARDLIGPDLRLHTTKLNMKSAGFGAAVEWHQDFAFYPHTNDDVIAIGVMIDDMAEENGPLMILKAGSLSIHHGRVVHGSALNTSTQDRRILFFEMMAADAFPVMGSMTSFGSLEEYNEKMLCGTPSITPRLADVPIRIPLPQPSNKGSIYEIQAGLKNRGFGIYDKS